MQKVNKAVEFPDPYTNTDTAHDPLIVSETDDLYGAPGVAEEEKAAANAARINAVLHEVVETILLAAVIWLLVNFTTARYIVEGQSMEPNLETGQFLIISRLSYFTLGDLVELGDPQRGDIIVFDFPGNPGDDYVKRVIGLPGEEVVVAEDGRVVVNGQPIGEPYLNDAFTQPYRGRFGTWTVPPDHYFVLGDNRNSSSDSRSWGMLDESYIVGKAWLSYWPPRDWGVIPHYDYGETAQPSS